ncbi:MAG: hypothetical protein EPN82_07280 [Bacteroidetes bacterium]|nr:MAG: hypothetical protein EPN82_07280 [Bacteroidota bacterium]
MPKASKYLWQAKHNKELCLFLKTTNKYDDWVITTAFYSSLHFVCYKLFPLKEKINGEERIFQTFEQYGIFYQRKIGKYFSKHQILSDLVGFYLPKIQPFYDSLMDFSMKARYNHYKLTTKQCETAIEHLNKIESCCVT